MKTPTKRATRRLAASLAIITALAMAQSVHADWWAWVGKDNSTTPCYFNDFGTPAKNATRGCWYRSGSSGLNADSFANYNHWIGFTNNGALTISNEWNGTIAFRESTTLSSGNRLVLDYNTKPMTFVAEDPSYGINSLSTMEINQDVELLISSGTYGFSQISLANNNTADKSAILTVNGSDTSLATTGELSIGYNGSNGSTGHLVVGDGVTVRTGANFALYKGDVAINGGNVTVGGTLHIAYRGSGEFALNGGEVDVATEIRFGGYYASDPTGLYLNGGMLSTPTIVWHNGSTTAGIVFNGGTLKAKSDGILIATDSHIAVSVGDGGGTIDNGGYDISIPKAISGTGGMTFKGNGTTTLSGANSYSGPTYVTPGTTLAVADETAKNNILANGLVVLSVPTEGQTVMTCTSALDDADLTKISSPLRPTTEFVFSDEGKTNIVVGAVGPELDNYWTGAANDGDLSNAANWKGDVPTTGTANIFCETNSTLMKGETFAPTAITFLAGSAAVTINGEFSGITQIANNSASMVEFKDAVEFSGNVDVVQNSGAVKFTGGATGAQLAGATDIHGIYTLTVSGDYTEAAGTIVKSDGEYRLLNGTFCKTKDDGANFHVDEGGKAVVKDAKIREKSGGAKLLGTFNGEFKVTGEFLVHGNGASSYVTHYMCDSGNGTFIVNKLRMTNRAAIDPAAKTIIGAGGIMREGSGYVRVPDSGSREIGSSADWTMYCDHIGSNTGTGYYSFYKAGGSSTLSTLVFNTTDYYDSSIGRTITCEAPIGGDKVTYAEKLSVTVKGKGRFVFANTSSSDKIFTGGLTVQDTATVEVKPNATPGNGAITLGAGTTLALTSTSSTFTALANTLNLPTGENEVATIRIDGARLRSGDNIIIAPVASGATANVTLDENSTAIAGRDASLKVEDGKLILSIESDGLMIIFR